MQSRVIDKLVRVAFLKIAGSNPASAILAWWRI